MSRMFWIIATHLVTKEQRVVRAYDTEWRADMMARALGRGVPDEIFWVLPGQNIHCTPVMP